MRVSVWCGLSNGSENPREPNLLGDLYSLLEFGMGEKDWHETQVFRAPSSSLQWFVGLPNTQLNTLQRCESLMCNTAGKPRGSTGNEDTRKKKNCFHGKKG